MKEPRNSKNGWRSSPADIRKLAWLRYGLRKYVRFSERAARAAGITPQQHQLLLGIGGYTGRGWATISELAEFLQERHNAVVGLVERATRKGLVRKVQEGSDRRFVRVTLTPKGDLLLRKLSELHHQKLASFPAQLLAAFKSGPKMIRQAKGA